MAFRIIGLLFTLLLLTQCQKLNLNVSNVYIEDRFIRIGATVENRTSRVLAIPAYNVNNNASNYYRIESAQQGLEICSNSINGISQKIIKISPDECIPFQLLFVIRKADKGIYSCKLVPVDKGAVDCAFFEMRIDRDIMERQSDLTSKSDYF